MKNPKTELTLQVPPSQISSEQWGYFAASLILIPFISFIIHFIFFQESDIYTNLGYLAFTLVLLFQFTLARRETKAIELRKLILNEEGIRYYSGYSNQDKDWKITWDSIKLIEIKLEHVSSVDVKLSVYTRTQKKPYETFIFRWIDSKTLNEEHVNLLNPKVEPVEFRLTSFPYPQEKFYDALNQTPLYQYFLQNNIPVKFPDSKLFTHLSHVVIWGGFFIIIFILLLISPFYW